jgi:hypothetical protein
VEFNLAPSHTDQEKKKSKKKKMAHAKFQSLQTAERNFHLAHTETKADEDQHVVASCKPSVVANRFPVHHETVSFGADGRANPLCLAHAGFSPYVRIGAPADAVAGAAADYCPDVRRSFAVELPEVKAGGPATHAIAMGCATMYYTCRLYEPRDEKAEFDTAARSLDEMTRRNPPITPSGISDYLANPLTCRSKKPTVLRDRSMVTVFLGLAHAMDAVFGARLTVGRLPTQTIEVEIGRVGAMTIHYHVRFESAVDTDVGTDAAGHDGVDTRRLFLQGGKTTFEDEDAPFKARDQYVDVALSENGILTIASDCSQRRVSDVVAELVSYLRVMPHVTLSDDPERTTLSVCVDAHLAPFCAEVEAYCVRHAVALNAQVAASASPEVAKAAADGAAWTVDRKRLRSYFSNGYGVPLHDRTGDWNLIRTVARIFDGEQDPLFGLMYPGSAAQASTSASASAPAPVSDYTWFTTTAAAAAAVDVPPPHTPFLRRLMARDRAIRVWTVVPVRNDNASGDAAAAAVVDPHNATVHVHYETRARARWSLGFKVAPPSIGRQAIHVTSLAYTRCRLVGTMRMMPDAVAKMAEQYMRVDWHRMVNWFRVGDRTHGLSEHASQMSFYLNLDELSEMKFDDDTNAWERVPGGTLREVMLPGEVRALQSNESTSSTPNAAAATAASSSSESSIARTRFAHFNPSRTEHLAVKPLWFAVVPEFQLHRARLNASRDARASVAAATAAASGTTAADDDAMMVPESKEDSPPSPPPPPTSWPPPMDDQSADMEDSAHEWVEESATATASSASSAAAAAAAASSSSSSSSTIANDTTTTTTTNKRAATESSQTSSKRPRTEDTRPMGTRIVFALPNPLGTYTGDDLIRMRIDTWLRKLMRTIRTTTPHSKEGELARRSLSEYMLVCYDRIRRLHAQAYTAFDAGVLGTRVNRADVAPGRRRESERDHTEYAPVPAKALNKRRTYEQAVLNHQSAALIPQVALLTGSQARRLEGTVRRLQGAEAAVEARARFTFNTTDGRWAITTSMSDTLYPIDFEAVFLHVVRMLHAAFMSRMTSKAIASLLVEANSGLLDLRHGLVQDAICEAAYPMRHVHAYLDPILWQPRSVPAGMLPVTFKEYITGASDSASASASASASSSAQRDIRTFVSGQARLLDVADFADVVIGTKPTPPTTPTMMMTTMTAASAARAAAAAAVGADVYDGPAHLSYQDIRRNLVARLTADMKARQYANAVTKFRLQNPALATHRLTETQMRTFMCDPVAAASACKGVTSGNMRNCDCTFLCLVNDYGHVVPSNAYLEHAIRLRADVSNVDASDDAYRFTEITMTGVLGGMNARVIYACHLCSEMGRVDNVRELGPEPTTGEAHYVIVPTWRDVGACLIGALRKCAFTSPVDVSIHRYFASARIRSAGTPEAVAATTARVDIFDDAGVGALVHPVTTTTTPTTTTFSFVRLNTFVYNWQELQRFGVQVDADGDEIGGGSTSFANATTLVHSTAEAAHHDAFSFHGRMRADSHTRRWSYASTYRRAALAASSASTMSTPNSAMRVWYAENGSALLTDECAQLEAPYRRSMVNQFLSNICDARFVSLTWPFSHAHTHLYERDYVASRRALDAERATRATHVAAGAASASTPMDMGEEKEDVDDDVDFAAIGAREDQKRQAEEEQRKLARLAERTSCDAVHYALLDRHTGAIRLVPCANRAQHDPIMFETAGGGEYHPRRLVYIDSDAYANELLYDRLDYESASAFAVRAATTRELAPLEWEDVYATIHGCGVCIADSARGEPETHQRLSGVPLWTPLVRRDDHVVSTMAEGDRDSMSLDRTSYTMPIAPDPNESASSLPGGGGVDDAWNARYPFATATNWLDDDADDPLASWRDYVNQFAAPPEEEKG